MGNTCASVHIAVNGTTADTIAGLVRAYGTFGFEPAATDAEGTRHVVAVRKEGDAFLSVYDSENAALDTGDLKQLALAASKVMKTAAVCTSLYDSDTFELVVFHAGKQVDLVMTSPEEYAGPLKALTDKSRATQWSKVFATPLTADRINQARTTPSAFADDALAELSRLIGLTGGQSQMNYQDVRDGEAFTHHLRFTRTAVRSAPEGEVILRNYFDPDNSRMLLVYPASWPLPVGEAVQVTWLLLSEGAGFVDGTLAIRINGPAGLTVARGFMEGSKFHNGQIVGPLETAPRQPAGTTPEEVLKATQFEVTEDSPPSSHTARFPAALNIPAKAADRPTQILIVLQLQVTASQAGEWEMAVTIKPTGLQHELPHVRLAAVEPTWVPIVSGLNPKAAYDTSDLVTAPPRGPLMLHEVQHKQASIRLDRRLNHFAIASNAAIVPDASQPNLDACRSHLEGWLRPLAERAGEIRIHAEKRMTERAYVGKSRKNLPLSSFSRDKAWQKLFDSGSNYQSALATIHPDDAAYPIAGVGLQTGLEQYPEQWRAHYEQAVAETLGKMRGRPFEPAPIVNTLHVFTWVLNHADCYGYMGTSIGDMKERLDEFASRHSVLQAWHAQYTWKPLFDHADDYHRTVYEDHSVLNWFRGILQRDGGLDASKMSLQWCRNVLRMVTPHMWICRALMEQVDRPALDAVARVTEAGDGFKIELTEGRGLDDLELALLPVLPVESARLRTP